MTRIAKDRQKYICCLCVILALVCAFCLLLPHLHECEGMQCPVCALASALKLWIPVTAGLFLISVTVLLACREWISVGCEGCSLVQLKVKLSD